MAYRRERNIRDIYEERFIPDRAGPYPRAPPPDRRSGFGGREEEYGGRGGGGGGFDYEGGSSRFYPNGGAPRSGYHGEEPRGYHGDSMHFPADRRPPPPARREEPYPYRAPREEPIPVRQMEFSGRTAPPPPAVRGPPVRVRALPAGVAEPADDTLMQAILNLDRREEADAYRRKGPFPPPRERSPPRRDVAPSPHSRDVAPSPHSRSGSSVSSRGYSPDRTKPLPYPPQIKGPDGLEKPVGPADHLWGGLPLPFLPPAGHDALENKERIPGLSDSPRSTTSVTKEEVHVPEERAEDLPGLGGLEESHKVMADDFQEARAQLIAAKAHEIEKVYAKDCETFGIVVRMLAAKEPSLEKQLQVPLRESLHDIRERCLDDLKQFITELDEKVRQEPV